MARYRKGHKERTRQAIVAAATPALRGQGIAGAGVGEIMGRAGFTHGGFYAHFASKDELVAEACAASVAEAGEQLLAVARRAPPDERIRGLLTAYLTPERRDSAGCTLAALGSELARQPTAVRDGFTRALDESLARIADTLPGPSAEARYDQALVLVAGMVGAMMLARAVSDPALSDRLLTVARDAMAGAAARAGECDGGGSVG